VHALDRTLIAIHRIFPLGTRVAMGSLGRRGVHMRSIIFVSLLAVACGGSSVSGTWNQPDGTIAVPAALGGGTVAANNTLVFDDSVSPRQFHLTMDLQFMGLTDTLAANGTYEDDGASITMTFAGFDIAQGSGDTAEKIDGNECVTLAALAGATVCFKTPQAATYTLSGSTLTIAIANEIVGGDMANTTLTLSRSK
jgi:ABC-type Fe3+-hydroxamate transport system substrate-binding protein